MCLLPEVCQLNFAFVSYLSGYRCFLRKARNKSKTGLHLPLGEESANFGNKLLGPQIEWDSRGSCVSQWCVLWILTYRVAKLNFVQWRKKVLPDINCLRRHCSRLYSKWCWLNRSTVNGNKYDKILLLKKVDSIYLNCPLTLLIECLPLELWGGRHFGKYGVFSRKLHEKTMWLHSSVSYTVSWLS